MPIHYHRMASHTSSLSSAHLTLQVLKSMCWECGLAIGGNKVLLVQWLKDQDVGARGELGTLQCVALYLLLACCCYC
jgi:hypothetical protein